MTERLWEKLFKRGVIVYKSMGLAGIDGDALVIGPPFTITDEEIELLTEAVGRAIEQVLA